MRKVGQNRERVPTDSRREIVASEEARSRVLGLFLEGVLNFLNSKPAVPGADGELSDWIIAMHGLADHGRRRVAQSETEKADMDLVEWLHDWLGPNLDPRKSREAILHSERLSEQESTKLADLYQSGDRFRFNREFERVSAILCKQWGLPPEFAARVNLSMENIPKLLRAARATLICLVVHDVHPLTLITRASEGSPEAVLKLIKVDKLFLSDSRTARVIREAAIQNNETFIKQMARAQNQRASLGARSGRHAYFLVLFFLELFDLKLPTLHEIYRVVDPHGNEYDSLQAFERDFQRRRELFHKSLAALDAELSQRKH